MPVKAVPAGRRKVKKVSSKASKSGQRSSRTSRRKTRTSGLSFSAKRNVLAGSLFIASLLFIAGLGYFKNLTKSFVSADNASNFQISEKDIYSVLFVSVESLEQTPVKTDEIIFNLIDKKNKKILQYNIPVSITIDVPGKYGEEEIGKVFALGSINDSGGSFEGIDLLERTMTSIFGYKVNRYILVDGNISSHFSKMIKGNEPPSPLIFTELSSYGDSVKTNLSFQEFMSLLSFVGSLPQDRLIQREVSYRYLTEPYLLDEEIRDVTFDSVISQEKKSIAILNGAGVAGLAAFGTRISENLGGRVVAVSNASMVYEESLIVADDIDSETVNYLSHSLGINKVLLKEQSTHISENELDRADVVVVIGLDNLNVL